MLARPLIQEGRTSVAPQGPCESCARAPWKAPEQGKVVWAWWCGLGWVCVLCRLFTFSCGHTLRRPRGKCQHQMRAHSLFQPVRSCPAGAHLGFEIAAWLGKEGPNDAKKERGSHAQPLRSFLPFIDRAAATQRRCKTPFYGALCVRAVRRRTDDWLVASRAECADG